MNTAMEKFADALMMELTALLPNVKFEVQDVVKENGTHLTGIVFKTESPHAPTFYVEELYPSYESGESDVDEIARDLVDRYTSAMADIVNLGIVNSLDFYEKAKSLLSFRTLEVKRNPELVGKRVSFELGCGLAAFPDIVSTDGRGGQFRAGITPEMLDTWGIDMETLERDVMFNAPYTEPPILFTITSGIFSTPENLLLKDELDSVEQMYVLSNKTGTMGASVLFYPVIQSKIHSLVGDYYVLPCSINEVIIIPESADVSVSDLRHMVKEANRSVVDEKDILSDNVYHYTNGKLGVA